MKTLLCAIAKLENEYIKEWVDYHIMIGFDHITLFDNNDVDGERLDTVLELEIESGAVDIVDYRGKKMCQLDAYQECLRKSIGYYDWTAFFDCDEFLTLPVYYDVKEFLGSDMFYDCKMVHINWMNYDDNEQLKKTEGAVLERFTHPFKEGRAYSNIHIKSIVKTDADYGYKWESTSHTPIGDAICYNSNGMPINGNLPYSSPVYEKAYLRHFITKSTEEFVNVKRKRSYADANGPKSDDILTKKYYFENNYYTKEKEDYLDELLKTENDEDIVFLTMSCTNVPFFVEEEQIVRETWAKPILEGKYKGVGYYSYEEGGSGCEMLVNSERRFFTNTREGLYNTLSKTKSAFKQLLSVSNFKYLVRTNTSTVINVPLTIELIKKIEASEKIAMSELYAHVDIEPYLFYPRGNFMILPRKIVEAFVNSDITEESLREKYGHDYADDSAIGFAIRDYYASLDVDYTTQFVQTGQEWINCSTGDVVWGNTDYSFEHLKMFPAIQVKKYTKERYAGCEFDTIRLVTEILNREHDYGAIADEILSRKMNTLFWAQPVYKYYKTKG